MLDDFRKQADDVQIDKLVSQDYTDEAEEDQDGRFLGLTPLQRMIIALILLLVTFLVGALWLLVNGKVVPPFM